MPYPNSPQNFPEFPISVGNRRVGLHPNGHAGPASYTQVTTGPLAGGDTVQASEFGLTWLENVDGAMSSDGLYFVIPINPTSGPVKSVKMKWVIASTNAEAAALANLSASIVNLMVVGR